MSTNQSYWERLPYEEYLKSLLEKSEVIDGAYLNPNFVSCILAHKKNNKTFDPIWLTLSDFVPDANFTLRYGMAHLIKCMIRSEGME